MNKIKPTKSSIPESEEIESDVTKSLRAKFEKNDKQEGSGSSENDMSLFPKPDFSLMKNKKMQEEYKKNLAIDKQRVDKTYEEFSSKFDSKSLGERIKQSEHDRQSEEIAKAHKLRPEDEHVGKALEQLFDEWISLFNRR